MKWVIEARNLWFSYTKRKNVLKDVNIRAVSGKITVIVGATGSGKTTLLFLLSGLLEPDKGIVYYNDKPLREILEDVKKHIGVLFQDPNDQLFNSTVYDEIAYSLRTLELNEEEIEEKVVRTARFLGIEDILGEKPYELSMGEKKKVALASIMVYDPDILFLDEPLANLDYNNSLLLEEIISEYRKLGKNIIVSTHNLEFALRIGDIIYGLVDGLVIGPFTPLEIVEKGFKNIGLPEPLIYKLCRKLGLEPKDIVELIRKI